MYRRGSFRSLRLAGLFVLSVLVLGTLGYMLIEKLSFLDAFYITTSMMTTEGHVKKPLSDAGQVLTIVLMISGVGSLLYTFSVLTEYVLEGHLSQALRRRSMVNKITALRNHAIICGFGRVGSQIADELSAAGTLFVVIDEKESSLETCAQRGYLSMEGDATSDQVLTDAGFCEAKSLWVATNNDAHNISITLSARHLSKTVFIVAWANQIETEVKLKLAGADRVLSPYTIGGHRMAHMALKPDVVDFV